jgi:hypothetical protein
MNEIPIHAMMAKGESLMIGETELQSYLNQGWVIRNHPHDRECEGVTSKLAGEKCFIIHSPF